MLIFQRLLYFNLISLLCSASLICQPVQAQQTFSGTLLNFIQDQALDQIEFQKLKALSHNGLSAEEAYLAQSFLKFLAPLKQTTPIQYTFPLGRQKKMIRFTYYPSYSEKQRIPGDHPLSMLAQISQGDALHQTREDENRCAASSLLNAYFILHGQLEGAFQSLGLPGNQGITYELVHLAQERLYRLANTDQQSGLLVGFAYYYNQSGEITKAEPQGELLKAAHVLKLKLHPLLGPTKDSLHKRKSAVQRFWQQYPSGVLLVMVHLNEKSGNIWPPDNSGRETNHTVMLTRQGGSYYLFNTGVTDNGTGAALRTLNSSEMESFVYQSRGHVMGVTR